MEDNNPPRATNTDPASGGIMDIQPPKPQPKQPETAPSEVNDVPQVSITEGELTTLSTSPESSSVPVSEPAPNYEQPASSDSAETNTENAISSSENPFEVDNKSGVSPSNPDQPEDNMQPLLAAKPAPKKSKPKLAIFFAALIALLLIGLSVVAYLASQGPTDGLENATHSATPNERPVTAEEIDQAQEEVEKAISQTDDNKDFPEDQLSNQSLGLDF